MLSRKCSGASAHPAEQGLPSTAFSSSPLDLESSCTGMGNGLSWCQDNLAAADPSSSPAAAPLWEEGKRAGMWEDRGMGSPAISLWFAGRWEEGMFSLDPGQRNLDCKCFMLVTLTS